MSRDPRKLRVFALADGLTIDVYRATRSFPPEERFGLQSQLRRATVSVATNIVEGSARRTLRDYLHYLTIALGSGSEARYLLGIASRLGYLDQQTGEALTCRFTELVRSLQTLINALELRGTGPKPEA
jgi:four helix bundle protein